MKACLLLLLAVPQGLRVSARPPVAAQEPVAMAEGLSSKAGVDSASGIAYRLIGVEGKAVRGEANASAAVPRLMAQCSKAAEGKLSFELLADEPGSSGSGEMVFQAPWKAAKGELFAPALQKIQVQMEFLGYVKEKPVTRQWEYPMGSAGLIRYARPGMRSANMEDVTYYLRYLRSLPTLRLTVPGKGTVEFETAKWQNAVKAEPLCKASGW